MNKKGLFFLIISVGMFFLLNACGTIGDSSESGFTFNQPTLTINKRERLTLVNKRGLHHTS